YPIGFDAFGLPAENAAIKHETTPALWTKKNVAYMTKQLRSMGASFDWSRAVNTSSPEYYRWTQWVFLKLHEKGLAYRASTTVNWCPNDKTVLANEQVVNGCCERCTATVEQREIEQWMFRTTAYADELIDDIEGMDWPSTTVAAQRNWIGRSEGALIKFNISGIPSTNEVEVFTTRADTLFGVTAVVISPELAQKWVEKGWQAPVEVRAYIKEALGKRELERMEEREKTGVRADIEAMNPINGESVPVWVADYVLGSYGTGAVMMVPAHDERDSEFAKKYGLPISNAPLEDRAKIVSLLVEKGVGAPHKTYRLRDWVLSRQRYWGAPIPMIKCTGCGYVPVPESQLPVKLPPLKDFKPADDGRSPLAKASRWLKVKCPKCGASAERETDTMDTFVDSSWYFIRYADPANANRLADADTISAWLPVPMYIGGPEHNTMHLLYARFITKALHSVGVVPFSEPFTARRNHSVILGPDGNRMSKSRGNVVDPDIEVAKYGADVVRMYLAFMGPYSDQTMPWDPNGITGINRFVHRAWAVFQADGASNGEDHDIERLLHAATKKVGEDIAELKYNTAISELMKLLNSIEQLQKRGGKLAARQAERLCLLLAPFAPHLAEEVWRGILGKSDSVHREEWPRFNAALLRTATVPVPVQVNGKVRAILDLAPDSSEQDAVFAAKEDANVARFLAEGEIRKVVYLPGKLLNFVVA
ncbi:MAG: leucine--tRNA ligase, partial [Candidatus Yanofskybacteria bacterium]|nr:leucine--tRNA ligase [Candidatus Yanofskybacteria bacterium]